MLYVLVLLLSLCSCFVGFLREAAEANVRHVQNGRKPNAGAAVFPNIPLVQLTYFLATWALEQVVHDAAYALVSLYSFVSMAVRFGQYRKFELQLKALVAANDMPQPRVHDGA